MILRSSLFLLLLARHAGSRSRQTGTCWHIHSQSSAYAWNLRSGVRLTTLEFGRKKDSVPFCQTHPFSVRNGQVRLNRHPSPVEPASTEPNKNNHEINVSIRSTFTARHPHSRDGASMSCIKDPVGEAVQLGIHPN